MGDLLEFQDSAVQTVNQAMAAVFFKEVLENLNIEVKGDLEETPMRWVKAFKEMTSGYRDNPKEILSKRFDQPAAAELVILKDVAFTSLCEHHLLHFSGVAHVAYKPSGPVVGLSKLARLVDCYAKRLQIQERMTRDVAEAIDTYLCPHAVGVVIEAHHSCMGCRGVKKPGATMVTTCLLGELKRDTNLRSEFLTLVRG